MRKLLIVGFLSVCASAQVNTDLMVGTGGGLSSPGNLFPGPTSPFGWMRVGPDTGQTLTPPLTGVANVYSTAGYTYTDQLILGFSHTRLSGTGVHEGGFLRVRPENHLPDPAPVRLLNLNHDLEQASPGYYALEFPEEQLRAELTATVRCAIHRYSKTGARGELALHLNPRSSLAAQKFKAQDVTVQVEGQSFTVSALQKGDFSKRYCGYTLYAYAELSTPPLSVTRGREISFTFPESTNSVELKVCLSATSSSAAQLNFDQEVRGKTFNEIRQATSATWQSYLQRAQVESSDPTVMRLYYTSLYHSLLMPSNFTNVDGSYYGFDRKVHTAKDYTFRTDMSLWDTFRTTAPLHSLIAPEVHCDSVRSLLDMADQAGNLPRWPSGAGPAESMFGSPFNFVIAEAYYKHSCAFDVGKALNYMVQSAKLQIPSSPSNREPECWSLGYCPSDHVDPSVSKTLEFAWADGVTGELAAALGQDAISKEFVQRGLNYRLVWNPEIKYFAPKDSHGVFQKISPNTLPYLDPLQRAQAYAEGSANQWRYTAPPQDLIRLFGGEAAFVSEAEAFMQNHNARTALIPAGGYWHGNEQDLHVPYLFNEAHRPDLTQKWVRWILADRYVDAPDGLAGNDDAGALSAWYVLSAIGIYPQPGTDRYWLGSPAVEAATWNLGDKRTLHVVVHNQAAKNIYVQRVLLNGVQLHQTWVRHADLLDARLEFYMADRPAPNGGY